jgi:DnaJ-class molecular chaperone
MRFIVNAVAPWKRKCGNCRGTGRTLMGPCIFCKGSGWRYTG